MEDLDQFFATCFSPSCARISAARNQPQVRARVDRFGPVQFLEEWSQRRIRSIVGSAEHLHPQNSKVVIRDDVGVRLEEFAQFHPRAMADPPFHEGNGHSGFRAEADHPDQVERQVPVRDDRLELLLLGELSRQDVARRVFAFDFRRHDLFHQLVDALFGQFEFPGEVRALSVRNGLFETGRPGRSPAELLAQSVAVLVGLSPARVDDS